MNGVDATRVDFDTGVEGAGGHLKVGHFAVLGLKHVANVVDQAQVPAVLLVDFLCKDTHHVRRRVQTATRTFSVDSLMQLAYRSDFCSLDRRASLAALCLLVATLMGLSTLKKQTHRGNNNNNN